ncbi:hypothetical protein PBI_SCTP2_289 [Salicola phage SCTP-2]|nr:hypothetical protein PBI_SCTP2_289 [Salicola phage SCTP-2]
MSKHFKEKYPESFIELSVEQILNALPTAVGNVQDQYFEFVKEFSPQFTREYINNKLDYYCNCAWYNIKKELKWKPHFWFNKRYYDFRIDFWKNDIINSFQEDFSYVLGKIFGYLNYNIDNYNFYLKKSEQILHDSLACGIEKILDDYIKYNIIDYIMNDSNVVSLKSNDCGIDISAETNTSIHSIGINACSEIKKIIYTYDNIDDVFSKKMVSIECMDMDDTFLMIEQFSYLYTYLHSYQTKMNRITELIEMCNHTETETIYLSNSMVKLLQDNLENNNYAEIQEDHGNDGSLNNEQSSVRVNKPLTNNDKIDINSIYIDNDDTEH